jgi:hypothetical protein
MGVYIYKGHTEDMITIQLQTNASLLQCVIPVSSPICFLTTDENHVTNSHHVFLLRCEKMAGEGMSFW